MAAGTVTEAIQTGKDIRVTVAVDEGAAGIVAYTVQLPIADLAALGSQAARTKAITDALKAERDKVIQKEAVIDRWLAQMIGKSVDLP